MSSKEQYAEIKRDADPLWHEIHCQLEAGLGVPKIEMNRLHWRAALQELEILRNELAELRRPAHAPVTSKPQFIGENGPMTAGDCARWLEAKHARHHELEDKASAELIRWQAQEIVRLRAVLGGIRESPHYTDLPGGHIHGYAGDCGACIAADVLSGEPSPSETTTRQPDGYAYRRHWPMRPGETYLAFDQGGEINGSKPIESVPYWLGTSPTRDADHCDFPDCEQHNTLIVERLRAAVKRILSMAVTIGCDAGHAGIEGECRKALEMIPEEPSLPLVTDRAQGTDCPYCEDDVPHRHAKKATAPLSTHQAVERAIERSKDPDAKWIPENGEAPQA
jgi:hypothetical protein